MGDTVTAAAMATFPARGNTLSDIGLISGLQPLLDQAFGVPVTSFATVLDA
jgi:hypothetical protein